MTSKCNSPVCSTQWCRRLCRSSSLGQGETRLAARLLKLEGGIPSHDTLGRVFEMIAPEESEAAFRRRVGMVIPALAEDTVVAIDGKRVTIDAMGTQTKIARTIRGRQVDYVLCMKDNHPGLLDSIMFAGLNSKGKLTATSTDEASLFKNTTTAASKPAATGLTTQWIGSTTAINGRIFAALP